MDPHPWGTGCGMKMTPVRLQAFLSGVDYPADKKTLVETARKQGADQDVVQTLQNLPRDQFNSANDVSEAFAKH